MCSRPGGAAEVGAVDGRPAGKTEWDGRYGVRGEVMATTKKAKQAKQEKSLGGNSPPPVVLSAGKRTVFRWLAALVVPAFVLLGLEVTLRLLGWGYPTHFFVQSKTEDGSLFTENPRFGWSFFPPRLARAPDPIRLSKAKPPGTCRIFVFGESAALGDPEPAYSFSRLLRELIEARCPDTKFEVINLGMTAISSHVIAQIAHDSVPFQADFWIIYMGNNEVIGPFGAGSVFGAKALPLPLIHAGLAARRPRLGQLINALVQRWSAPPTQTQEWEGMKMMLQEQIRSSDPALQRVYNHFASNLQSILAAAARSGAKPIVCSVSSNLKDCAPFASLHRPGLSEPRKREWEGAYESAIGLESRQEFDLALAQYRRAVEIDDTYAELAFRVARCHLALREAAPARAWYARARDLDALRFRADTPINNLIRDVCAKRAAVGVQFFDSDAVLTNACQFGIPGAECFWDHVHLNFAGNYLMARGLAEQVSALLPEAQRPVAQANPRVLTETECAQRLAFTDWDQRSVLDQMWRRVLEPPFTTQLDQDQRLARWSAMRADMERRTDQDGLARAAAIYRTALDRRPDDWVLHHRLAFLLEASGDLAGAEQHWKRVLVMLPGYPDACFKLGDISARQSRFAQAAQYYFQVLQSRPNSFEAMNGLGLVRMNEGQLEQAARLFEQALRLKPKFAQAHINWGLVASRRGLTAEAEAHYREALRCAPDSAAAHINLGNLLAAQQKHLEAIDHYQKAIRLQPRAATIHFALGNSLQAVGRAAQAVEQYREAVRFNPALAEAHFNLGVTLAKQGDLPGAAVCFQQAVRLNPDDPQARLNLGVALARQNRLGEARAQFKAVLRLDPANPTAQHYLQAATAREGAKP
jgi:tetratricopeptide (TPR) repeat protein